MAGKLPPGKAETRVVDAGDHAALVAAAGEADLVLNALATAWDIPVMEACLDARRHYLDMGTGGPREITGTADLDEQFALHDEFAKRDRAALISFGIDPGVSDVFARALYDQFDTLEKLLVLDGDNATVEGYELACSFSVETMIEECLLPPTVFRDGREDRNEPLSVFLDFAFPEPVGELTLWNVDHEESQLMPMFLAGKGLRDADLLHRPGPDVSSTRCARSKRSDSTGASRWSSRARPSRRSASSRRASRGPSTWAARSTARSASAPSPRAPSPASGRRFLYQITSHDEAWTEKRGYRGRRGRRARRRRAPSGSSHAARSRCAAWSRRSSSTPRRSWPRWTASGCPSAAWTLPAR